MTRTCCSLTEVGILAAVWVQHSGVHHCGPRFTHFFILSLPTTIDSAFRDSALWPRIRHSGVWHSGLHPTVLRACRGSQSTCHTVSSPHPKDVDHWAHTGGLMYRLGLVQFDRFSRLITVSRVRIMEWWSQIMWHKLQVTLCNEMQETTHKCWSVCNFTHYSAKSTENVIN